MANSGAKSADYLEWLDFNLANQLNNFILIKKYVLKTSAVGISRHDEFVAMTTNSASVVSSSLIRSVVASNTGLAKYWTRLIRAPVEWIDALFRHLRNAIAHGQCAQFGECDMSAFQDSNKDENISFRFELSKTRLQRWITRLNRLEITGV